MQEPITAAIWGMPSRGEVGLVEEDPAEVLLVGEHVVLHRQERAAGVDEVDARQLVGAGDLLRAQVLLDRDRVVGAALDGGVVGHDHAVAALDPADAGDDAGAGYGVSSPLPSVVRRTSRTPRAGSARGTGCRGRAARRPGRGRAACRGRCASCAPSREPPWTTRAVRSRSSLDEMGEVVAVRGRGHRPRLAIVNIPRQRYRWSSSERSGDQPRSPLGVLMLSPAPDRVVGRTRRPWPRARPERRSSTTTSTGTIVTVSANG